MVSPAAQVSNNMWDRLISGKFLILNEIVQSNVWQSADEKCRNDVQRVSDGLKNEEWWSYQVIDASTKIPNSILVGNLVDLGNYDECLQIRFPNSETTGQHCLAHFALNLSRADNSLQAQPSFTWSYCIPSTCRAENLEHVLNSTWFEFTGSSASISPNQCHVPGESSWTAQSIFGVAFCAFILILCIASTLYDIWPRRGKNSFHTLLCSFSYYTNGKRLITVGQRADMMKCLDGIRFLTICWVILGHNYFYLTATPVINTVEMTKMIENISFGLLCSAVMAVDTFFFLSGLLNAYYLFKILDKTKSFPVFTFYFHRYIRTTPALGAIILIYATWFIKLGDGPLWHQMNDQSELFCKKYWWSTILYISNYYNPVEQCAGQSWFLAVDTQLFWISPLVIIPCWRWPKISKFYLTFLLFISCAIQFAVAYIDKFRASFSFTQDIEEYTRTSHYMYTPTHMRITPYIMGIMFGMFLHHQRKSNRKLSLTKLTVLAGWLVSTVLCLSVVLGMHPFMQPLSEHPYNRLESTFYISLHRVAWCMGLAWIIIACLQGYGGIVNSLLSWDGFVPLSRMTYCIYLTHMAIQQFLAGTTRTNNYFSDFRQVHEYFGDLVMAIIAGCIFCLSFESPVQMIEKYFRQPKENKNLEMGNVNENFVNDELEKKVSA